MRMGQGRLDTAEEHLRKAIESEPEFYEAYYVLGQVHARAKRTADARECFRVFEAKKAAIEARSTIWKDATRRARCSIVANPSGAAYGF